MKAIDSWNFSSHHKNSCPYLSVGISPLIVTSKEFEAFSVLNCADDFVFYNLTGETNIMKQTQISSIF